MSFAAGRRIVADRFGKVAVIYGGWSAEREVSLDSGSAVLTALQSQGIDAHGLDLSRDDLVQELQNGSYDRVFNVLHGRGGEDGTLQGLLEFLQLPYTGCDVRASAVSMDKLMTKQFWLGQRLNTPDYEMLVEDSDFDAVTERLGLPLMVKPADEGSSVGMSKVSQQDQLESAYQRASQYDCPVFAEQWVEGVEYTVSILGDDVLPVIRVETDSVFYDYEAKYQSDDTRYICPCGLDEANESQIQLLAKQAFDALGAKGWGRVDLMRDAQGRDWLIELNTVPGMTSHSLVPKSAEAAGMSFEQVVVRILESAR